VKCCEWAELEGFCWEHCNSIQETDWKGLVDWPVAWRRKAKRWYLACIQEGKRAMLGFVDRVMDPE
jgi:hypothetical protein